MRKKILEEYVQHVYRLKISHQAQYDKLEEIYKSNLDEMADIVDGDIDAAVRYVRDNADKALEMIRGESLQNNNKGKYFLCPLVQKIPTKHSSFSFSLSSDMSFK